MRRKTTQGRQLRTGRQALQNIVDHWTLRRNHGEALTDQVMHDQWSAAQTALDALDYLEHTGIMTGRDDIQSTLPTGPTRVTINAPPGYRSNHVELTVDGSQTILGHELHHPAWSYYQWSKEQLIDGAKTHIRRRWHHADFTDTTFVVSKEQSSQQHINQLRSYGLEEHIVHALEQGLPL